MLVSIAVVAHSARKAQAFDLAIALDASVAYDIDGIHGPGVNHRRAWELADTYAADWCLVIEDDALLCTDFHQRLSEVLPTAPTPIVSLYAGTSYPLHLAPSLARSIRTAHDHHTPWVTAPTLNHAVAVCIRQPLVESMLDHTHNVLAPIDEAITTWAQRHDLPVSYTVPSLVDHRDQPTVITHPDGIPRTQPRKAVRFAG